MRSRPLLSVLLSAFAAGCAGTAEVKIEPLDTAAPADSGDPCAPASFWADADGDGYGAGAPVAACEAPAGHVADDGDCDDADAAVHPGAVEACNGRDDDCDGAGDEDQATWYADADGDGYGDPATAATTCSPVDGAVADGTDCDDADATVSPGAQEVCGDGDDDDCDGRPDTAAAPATWHPDDDGDGYGHMYDGETSCDPPEGYVLDGSDCRPNDAEAHPGAAERCNDDDDDCDRAIDEDFEVDGDGHVSAACGGDDCDDLDASVFPGVEEVCDDGKDNDCDGHAARCGYDGTIDLGGTDAKAYAATANYDAGRIVDVGDVNGDGTDDLVVPTMYADGYSGGAYVLYGPLSGTSTLDAAGDRIEGSRSTYMAGRSVGVADVNGDGFDDVGIGAPDGTDMQWIVYGPLGGDVDLAADYDVSYTGVTNTETGHGSDLADVNGDGVGDAVIGAYEDATGAYLGGTVFIDYGPIAAGDYTLADDADARLIGDTSSAYAGRYVRAGEDVDGDGVGDILAAAPYSSMAAPYGGAAYLVYGGVTGDLDLSAADGVFRGEAASDYAGEELALGDVDGDGLADVILGSYSSAAARQGGAVYVVYGPASGATDLASADVIVRGTSNGQYLGMGLAVADLDGDGAGELLAGAIGDATAGPTAGAAYLFFGPLAATLTPADAQAVFLGEDAADAAGEGVNVGDFDGDGALDVAIGATGEATGGSAAGAVYVTYPTR